MSDLIRREVAATTTVTTTDDGRTIAGIAVPLDEPTQIVPGFHEQIARGAIDTTTMPMLFWRHTEPIGTVTDMRETDAGLEITARISDTTLGRDAATLAADGAVRCLSVGFYEVDYTDTTTDDDSILRTQTRIDLREISLVPIPAYDGAQITSVRSKPTKENTMTDTTSQTVTRDDLEPLSTSLTEIERRMALLETNATTNIEPHLDTRSAAEVIQAAIRDDETALAAIRPHVGRAVDATTSADARYQTPTFIRDLTRLIDNANPLMSLFATGALPATGGTLEFARLKTNTIKVKKQAAEGDALVRGSVSTETDTARIETYGGATVLSRQVVERSVANVVDTSLRALAIEAGRELATDFGTFFETVVAAQASKAITTTTAAASLDWKALLHMLLDASEAYEDLALTCDGLVVNRATFEAMAGMTDTSGRPILTVASNTGTNAIGTVSSSGRYVTLDGLRVVTNRYLGTGMGDGVVGAFYNSEAIRTYASPVASLQDTSIYDLTQGYSVYRYAAFADEIPAAIIPLKMGA